jgi:polysaccharide biosynthesis/export protein
MIRYLLGVLVASAIVSAVTAEELGNYKINPGDVLEVFVWDEESLTREVIVRPDGFISMPLLGELQAGGVSPGELSQAIAAALGEYVNDEPVVTVSLRSLAGNVIYVLGKVNRPGAFPVMGSVDVTQALALAGGLNTFADENDIQVLRRDENGTQSATEFNYSGVKSGKKLSSNIMLQSGDVVVVP